MDKMQFAGRLRETDATRQMIEGLRDQRGSGNCIALPCEGPLSTGHQFDASVKLLASALPVAVTAHSQADCSPLMLDTVTTGEATKAFLGFDVSAE
jgi:hypothetical protein